MTKGKRMAVVGRIVKSVTLAVLSGALLAGCSGQISVGPGAGSSPAGARVAQGPPAHAPAHGYRRNFQYRYWSKQDVYYDLQNRQYVWFDAGVWRVGVTLPDRFRIDPEGGMFMESETPLPWLDRGEPRGRGVIAGYYE